MRVDSFAYLPRSFQPLYANPARLPGEEGEVWAPFEKRLAESRIALVTSAGAYVPGEQASFDLDRERREPTWGDPTWRPIPHDGAQGGLDFAHLHINTADALADHEVVLPRRALDALVADGVVAAAAPTHASVMGFQESGLQVWREHTAPELAALFRSEDVDGLVFAPV
jgi:hypothetical protein